MQVSWHIWLSPLESIDSTLTELFDLKVKTENLKSKYNTKVLNKRELLVYCYRKLAPALTKCLVFIKYVSRGISEFVAENVYLKGKKIEADCKSYFLDCDANMQFVGSNRLEKF